MTQWRVEFQVQQAQTIINTTKFLGLIWDFCMAVFHGWMCICRSQVDSVVQTIAVTAYTGEIGDGESPAFPSMFSCSTTRC